MFLHVGQCFQRSVPSNLHNGYHLHALFMLNDHQGFFIFLISVFSHHVFLALKKDTLKVNCEEQDAVIS